MLLFPSLAPPLTTLQTGAGIYFTRGKKNLLSDHPCTPRAPPEPYRKGSSAPAIITNGKAARPPCSSSHQLQSNKQHTDVGSFQQSLKETRIPGTSTHSSGKGSAAGLGRDTTPICSAGATSVWLPRSGNRLSCYWIQIAVKLSVKAGTERTPQIICNLVPHMPFYRCSSLCKAPGSVLWQGRPGGRSELGLLTPERVQVPCQLRPGASLGWEAVRILIRVF